jgi:hypothetical protein
VTGGSRTWAPGDLTRDLASWLEAPDPERVAEAVACWSAAGPGAGHVFRRAVVMHGLAPHLAHGPAAAAVVPALLIEWRDWLADEDARNRRRIERLHTELEAILRAAADASIEVLPLKGAVLTTMPGSDPFRRPMADLDLLVRPPDRAVLGGVLERLGYRAEAQGNPRPTHDVFIDPGGGRIVFPDGEHPDNPRRVEVHVEVKRHLWGWVDDDDLTPYLWADTRSGTILGQPVVLPSPDAMLAHVAIHAASDLLAGRGRLVQWLDLAAVAPLAPIERLPHPRLAWLSLALARRVLPTALGPVDPTVLEWAVPPRLRRWAARVALDARCGLTAGRSPAGASDWSARWQRWRPDAWRLAAAHGEQPLPLALARHVARVGRLAVGGAFSRS